jgi:terminase small subunit-like protein
MSRDKRSSEQSGPTTRFGRQIVYDREIFISICARLLRGEDLKKICATPPMPIEPVFMGWVEDHQEARAIYRSVHNFRSDRELAKQLAVFPARATVAEWEEQVRENCERGWPADWIERKYTPPDWNKVYPLLGGPPVWSTENIEAYTELLNGFTDLLEPRDMMELMCTKEAADATWEEVRVAREKNALPERKYQQRQQVVAELQRARGATAATVAKPATALDHSRGLEAGFPHYRPRRNAVAPD